jgi:signal peptidase I
MEPTLHCARGPGCRSLKPEYVVVNHFAYTFAQPRRGDVVIVTLKGAVRPCKSNKPLVKRIIALPGDRLQQRGRTLYLNNRQLHERYVPGDGQSDRPLSPVTLDQGKFYVLGDNRRTSCDSRDFGPITSEEISGRVELVYSPLLRFRLP